MYKIHDINQKKKDKKKDITLRMKENSFKIIHEYAEVRGLSVNAYLNSIVDSYAEWIILVVHMKK